MSDREPLPESEPAAEPDSGAGAEPTSGGGTANPTRPDTAAAARARSDSAERVVEDTDSDADHVYRMPFTVRAAQVLAVGLAVIGLGCAVSAGWLSGSHAALVTGASFVASWLLGLVALTFGAEGDGIRVTAVLLAVLNGLWTVPSILLGRPPGWLGPAVSVLVIGLLMRRSAREWFEP